MTTTQPTSGEPNTWPRDGFRRAWRILVAKTSATIRDTHPGATAEMREIAESERDAERLIARAAELVPRHNMRLPYRRAIEAGAAYELSLHKLKTVNERSQTLAEAVADERDVEELDLVVDSWFIYLDRYPQATKKFLDETIKAIGTGLTGARSLMRELERWQSDAATKLAPGRNEVAHANTNWIRGIDEDNLWQPMIVLGLAEPEALESFGESRRSSAADTFFPSWHERFAVARGRLNAEGDAFCGRLADLLSQDGG